jgi:hypothetical protein
MLVSNAAEVAWARFKELQIAAKLAEAEAAKAFNAIPRLTVEDIAPLVEIYERGKTA